MDAGYKPIANEPFWREPGNIDDLLARKLHDGSLSLVVGAGVSVGFNLPTWDKLVERMCLELKEPLPPATQSLTKTSNYIKNKHFPNDSFGFSQLVRKCLYSDPGSDSSMVLASPLLQALGSLLVSSMRGRAGSLISFNFDDLIETYLRLLGFVVRSEPTAPYWAVNADMQVFHPHGLLPRDTSKPVTKIVFTSADFDEVIGRDDNAWNQSMRSVIGGTMPLFIGLSGEDQRLRSLLAAVKSRHPAIERDGAKYWGVRPTLKTDATADVEEWVGHGIAPRYLETYADFPAWILGICQKAAAYSSISRNA